MSAPGSLGRKSFYWYTGLSLALSLLFVLAASVGRYETVARWGGATWVFLLSMIITMPLVTSRLKKGSMTQPHH